MLIASSSKRKIAGILLFVILFAMLSSCAVQGSGCRSPIEAVETLLQAMDKRNVNVLVSLLSPRTIEKFTHGNPSKIHSVLRAEFNKRADMDIVTIEAFSTKVFNPPFTEDRLVNYGVDANTLGLDDNITELVSVSYRVTVNDKEYKKDDIYTTVGSKLCGKIGEYWYILEAEFNVI